MTEIAKCRYCGEKSYSANLCRDCYFKELKKGIINRLREDDG